MEIDLTSIIIAIVALSFFFVPVMYDQLSKKKSSRKIEKQLFDSAGNLHLIIAQHDVWHDSYAIGIDTGSRKVLYLNKKPNNNREILIDLAEVKKCRVSKTGRNIMSGEKRMTVTEKVDLNLSFLNSKRPDKSLEFFNGKKGDSLSGEITLAEKWAGVINSNLNSNR